MTRIQKKFTRFVLRIFQENLIRNRRTIKKIRRLSREQGCPLPRKFQKAAATYAARAAAFAADTGFHVSYGIKLADE